MRNGLAARFGHAVETLTPGYFALVMASGIVSIGMHLQRFTALSVVLLAVCAAAFVALLVLNAWRLLAYRKSLVEDFMDPARAFGFFTFVAGDRRAGHPAGHRRPRQPGRGGLLAIGLAIWLVLGYVIPWTAVLGREERPVIHHPNGTWFIWVVASQSVAAAAATLEPVHGPRDDLLALLAVVSWSARGVPVRGGGGVRLARLMLYQFTPEDIKPPYWVVDGRHGDHRARRRADRRHGRCAHRRCHPEPARRPHLIFWASRPG